FFFGAAFLTSVEAGAVIDAALAFFLLAGRLLPNEPINIFPFLDLRSPFPMVLFFSLFEMQRKCFLELKISSAQMNPVNLPLSPSATWALKLLRRFPRCQRG